MEILYEIRLFVKCMLGISTRYSDTYRFEEKVAIERAKIENGRECPGRPNCTCGITDEEQMI